MNSKHLFCSLLNLPWRRQRRSRRPRSRRSASSPRTCTRYAPPRHFVRCPPRASAALLALVRADLPPSPHPPPCSLLVGRAARSAPPDEQPAGADRRAGAEAEQQDARGGAADGACRAAAAALVGAAAGCWLLAAGSWLLANPRRPAVRLPLPLCCRCCYWPAIHATRRAPRSCPSRAPSTRCRGSGCCWSRRRPTRPASHDWPRRGRSGGCREEDGRAAGAPSFCVHLARVCG